MKFEPRQYSQSITTHGEDLLVVRPAWWRRVFLREKPRTISVSEVYKALANAAKENEEELLKEIWSR